MIKAAAEKDRLDHDAVVLAQLTTIKHAGVITIFGLFFEKCREIIIALPKINIQIIHHDGKIILF